MTQRRGPTATPSVAFPWIVVSTEATQRTSLIFHSRGAAVPAQDEVDDFSFGLASLCSNLLCWPCQTLTSRAVPALYDRISPSSRHQKVCLASVLLFRMSRIVRSEELFRASKLKVVDTLHSAALFVWKSLCVCWVVCGVPAVQQHATEPRLLPSPMPDCTLRDRPRLLALHPDTLWHGLDTFLFHKRKNTMFPNSHCCVLGELAEFRTAPPLNHSKHFSSTLIRACGVSRVPDVHSSKKRARGRWRGPQLLLLGSQHRVVTLPL